MRLSKEEHTAIIAPQRRPQMDDQMDDQINFDKAFSDMAEQVAVMNRECNRLQAALDRAEADKARAVDAEQDAVQFLYNHGELTYSAANAAIRLLTGNDFRVIRKEAKP